MALLRARPGQRFRDRGRNVLVERTASHTQRAAGSSYEALSGGAGSRRSPGWASRCLLPPPLIIITALGGGSHWPPFRLGEAEAGSWLRAHRQKPSLGGLGARLPLLAGLGSRPLGRAPTWLQSCRQPLDPCSTEPHRSHTHDPSSHSSDAPYPLTLWPRRQFRQPTQLVFPSCLVYEAFDF